MNADIVALRQAIITALQTATGLAVWTGTAPPSAQAPFLIVAHYAGGEDNLTPTQGLNVQFLVKAISEDSTVAGGHAATADSTMMTGWKTGALTAPAGWRFIGVARTQWVDLAEASELRHKLFHQIGGVYRILMEEE